MEGQKAVSMQSCIFDGDFYTYEDTRIRHRAYLFMSEAYPEGHYICDGMFKTASRYNYSEGLFRGGILELREDIKQTRSACDESFLMTGTKLKLNGKQIQTVDIHHLTNKRQQQYIDS